MRVRLLLVVLAFALTCMTKDVRGGRLTVEDGHFYKDGRRVFLAGVDDSYKNFGPQFASEQYENKSRDNFERTLNQIHNIAGNSVRIWVQLEEEASTDVGYDTETITRLITNLQSYLRTAEEKNVLVFITLWNAAVDRYSQDGHISMVNDTAELQRYIDNTLIPLVTALKDEPALGGWHIINEPEGVIIAGDNSNNPCENTSALSGTGSGWEGQLFSAREIQRFINLQAAAIHRTDPDALVSVGVWNPIDNTDAFGLHDLFKDECLLAAGGESRGTLDFYQFHVHATEGKLRECLPFEHVYADYLANGKPIFIEVFPDGQGQYIDLKEAFVRSYNTGYTGIWTNTVFDASLVYYEKDINDQAEGGVVRISLNESNSFSQ